MPLDGCVNIYRWPGVLGFKFKASALQIKQDYKQPTYHDGLITDFAPDTPAKYNVVFSAESSNYFGFQVYCNHYAFTHTKQKGGTWTRLITSRGPDDMMDTFPTYHAPRHMYAHRYGPFNKADIFTKWLNSANAPKEEVLVVIDPDNFLTNDLSPMVELVKPGHALAEPAFFYGMDALTTKLYKMFCTVNCDFKLDLVAVPYFVHRDDMAKMAPVWKRFIIQIREAMDLDPAMKQEYAGLALDWCAEMFGYIFAAAHVGVKHELKRLQVRDVEARPSQAEQASIYMIHMGRAFVPPKYFAAHPELQQYYQDAPDFAHLGTQVWCKCNDTAGDWFFPKELPADHEWNDFQSKVTLTLMRDSLAEYGPIAKGTTYRGSDYYHGLL
jgi:hypothetical protein